MDGFGGFDVELMRHFVWMGTEGSLGESRQCFLTNCLSNQLVIKTFLMPLTSIKVTANRALSISPYNHNDLLIINSHRCLFDLIVNARENERKEINVKPSKFIWVSRCLL